MKLMRIIGIMLTCAVLAGPGGAARKKRAPAKPKEPMVSFWADNRDDVYHQSTCTTATRASAAGLVNGSEAELIRLGYYPDPACLPNRSVATRAGRLVRVEGGTFAPTGGGDTSFGGDLPPQPKKDPIESGGFPGLAPPPDLKPGEVKPGEAKPATGTPAPPAKPPTTGAGGFPGVPNLGVNPNPPAATRPDPAVFRTSVLPVMRICLGCHGQNGQPANRKFPLLRGESDDVVQRNYQQAVRRIVFKNPNQSLLLAKPLRRVTHGGGQVLQENSPEHRALANWINGVPPQP